jgi:hypothetical protein
LESLGSLLINALVSMLGQRCVVKYLLVEAVYKVTKARSILDLSPS